MVPNYRNKIQAIANQGQDKNCLNHNLRKDIKKHRAVLRHYLELGEDLGNVGLAGEPDHDVQLLQLDVDGIVVLDEEDLHLVLEDVGPLLDDEVDVAQGHVLHLHGGENRGGITRGSQQRDVVYLC
jgi:hypothetical protein